MAPAPPAPTPAWRPVCPLDDVPSDAPLGARVDGQRLVVVRCGPGAVAVFDDACPHEGYPLSKGTLVDGELVCPWHNFRFDASSGTCRKGDEDALPKPVRIVDGTVEVDLTPPPVAQRQARQLESLTAAVLHQRDGQLARDLARLLQLGVSPDTLLARAVHLDAKHSEWGTSHVLPMAIDLRSHARIAAEAERPVDATGVLWSVFQHLSERVVRRPERTVPDSIDPGDLATVGDRLRAHVLAEETDRAEALARGAVHAGWSLADAQQALLACCADHLLSFGHPLIYAAKLTELPPLATAARADVVGSLVFQTANATREDSVPEWRPVRTWLAQQSDRLDAVADRWSNPGSTRPPDGEAWLGAVTTSRWRPALDTTLDALEAGAAPQALARILVLAGATRVLRFDLAHDQDPTIQDGWLDATHRLTAAHAVDRARGRLPARDWLAMALRVLVWIVRGAPLDGLPDEVRAPVPGTPADLGHAIAASDRPLAQSIARGLPPSEAVLHTLLHQALARPLTRGILVAHLVKTARVGVLASRDHDDPRPMLAAVRLLASPIQAAPRAGLVHDAIRFVVDGAVPRTLT